jgi:hypothetical protein
MAVLVGACGRAPEVEVVDIDEVEADQPPRVDVVVDSGRLDTVAEPAADAVAGPGDDTTSAASPPAEVEDREPEPGQPRRDGPPGESAGQHGADREEDWAASLRGRYRQVAPPPSTRSDGTLGNGEFRRDRLDGALSVSRAGVRGHPSVDGAPGDMGGGRADRAAAVAPSISGRPIPSIVVGPLEASEVDRVVASSRHRFIHCVDSAGSALIELSVVLSPGSLAERVKPDRVTVSRAEGLTDDAERCIIERMRNQRFPKPAGEVATVTLGYAFTPE